MSKIGSSTNFYQKCEEFKSEIGSNSLSLNSMSICITKFLTEEIENTQIFFRKKEFKKSFLRYKALEELLYIIIRA